MVSFVSVTDIYLCDQCKSAKDIYGRGCAHGLMFLVLLMMNNIKNCHNYLFDRQKVEKQLRHKEEERRNG